MKNIDWSQAPEGATHINTNDAGSKWWRKDSDRFYEYIGSKWRERLLYPKTPKSLTPRPTTPTWSGEGLPPVGTVCEWKHKRSDSQSWVICAIVGYHDDWVFVLDQQANGDTPLVRDSNTWKFRPLKSPRDRWVEAAHDKCTLVDDNDFVRAVLGQAYDAMQSAALPIPEADQ